MPAFSLFSSGGGGGSGVTSVGLSAPSILSVSGSPVTSAGTLALALATQAQKLVFAGPASGADAVPTFRSLFAADIPDLSGTYLTKANNLSDLANAGTARTNLGLGSLAVLSSINNSNWSGTVLAVANGGSGTATPAIIAGSNVTVSGSWPNQTINASAPGTGTVTSVSLTAPGILSVAGSPITTSGTLALTLATQSANLVWAGPTTGAAATPTFRALVAADVPDISGTYLTKANNLSDVASAATARTNLGLGSLAVLNSVNNSNWSGTALAIGNGGTGQTTATAAFNTLSPLTTLGDVLYGGAAGAGTRLAGNTTAAKQFLTQTGTGSASAAPAWAAIASADVPWASPGTIGSTAPSSGAFTTLNSTGAVSLATLATGNSTVTIGGSPSADRFSALIFAQSNAVQNWQIDSNAISAGLLCITPSTANGGQTFTTPAVRISPNTISLSATPSGTALVNIGGFPSGDNGSALRFFQSNSTTNWQIDSNTISGGILSITPSTLAGGNTFTTPVARFTPTEVRFAVPIRLSSTYSSGVVAATGTLQIQDSTGTVYNVLVHT